MAKLKKPKLHFSYSWKHECWFVYSSAFGGCWIKWGRLDGI